MSLMKGHLAVKLYSQLPLKGQNSRRPGVGLHLLPPYCCHVIGCLTAQYSPGVRIRKKLFPTLKSIFFFFFFCRCLSSFVHECVCVIKFQKRQKIIRILDLLYLLCIIYLILNLCCARNVCGKNMQNNSQSALLIYL